VPTPQKLTGKAGSFVYSGTSIPFTTLKPKVAVDFADSTDSSNYDPASNLVHKSQIAATTQIELGIEGWFDLNTTDQVLIAALYSAGPPVLATIYLMPGKVLGHGYFDLESLECEVPIGDMVKFTASLKSNGVFTHGS